MPRARRPHRILPVRASMCWIAAPSLQWILRCTACGLTRSPETSASPLRATWWCIRRELGMGGRAGPMTDQGRRHRGGGRGHPEGHAPAQYATGGIGHPIEGIDFVAMSHYHADHTANANAFANSTWIVQQRLRTMFQEGRSPSALRNYAGLKSAERITLDNADHDVFGRERRDKTARGTRRPQMLFCDWRIRPASSGG